MSQLAIINEALSQISEIESNKKFPRVSTAIVDNLRGHESQGEYNEHISIYSLGVDDLHIKIVEFTDSYGDGRYINSIQIVTPVKKEVTDFVTVK